MTDGRFLNRNAIQEKTIARVRKLNDLALQRGETLAQMALKWVLKDSDVTSVLIGASKPEQILDNLGVQKGSPLCGEELALIDSICGE